MIKFTNTAAIFLAISLLPLTQATAAPQAIVVPLQTQSLPEVAGKEVLVIEVTYPPGAVDPTHRHDAHAFVYVLEGTIVMGLRGGKEVVLTKGQTFYEGPDDVHVVGRNASDTEAARFTVTLIKKTGVDFFIPVKENDSDSDRSSRSVSLR